MVLKGLRDTLTREGYNVVTAANPFLGLEELKRHTFSVIISDNHMPGMMGMQFLAQAREIQPNASRILITAVLSLDTVIDAINKGEIYRFIVKPWLREELLATVKNAVQRYELIDNNTVLQSKAVVMNRELTEANRALELQIARVADRVGSLEMGKDADFVIFNGAWYEPSTRVDMVFGDGQVVYDRSRPEGK